MATMTIRCEESDKKMASEIANYYGLDLSSVTRAFWKEMIRTNAIPLSLRSYEPNEESLKAIEETNKLIADNSRGKKYKDGKAVLEDVFCAMEEAKELAKNPQAKTYSTAQELHASIGS